MSAPSKRICIPFERAEYERILGDRVAFRKYLDHLIAQYPELFPAAIQRGYHLHDRLHASDLAIFQLIIPVLVPNCNQIGTEF